MRLVRDSCAVISIKAGYQERVVPLTSQYTLPSSSSCLLPTTLLLIVCLLFLLFGASSTKPPSSSYSSTAVRLRDPFGGIAMFGMILYVLQDPAPQSIVKSPDGGTRAIRRDPRRVTSGTLHCASLALKQRTVPILRHSCGQCHPALVFTRCLFAGGVVRRRWRGLSALPLRAPPLYREHADCGGTSGRGMLPLLKHREEHIVPE